MKSFREWKKINESYDFSLGIKTPGTVAATGNLTSFYDLLEAKKKAMKKKMELDAVNDDEENDSVPTGDGEVVKPKSVKDIPQDDDLDDEVDADEDMDDDDDEDMGDDDMGPKEKDMSPDKLAFMKKKMKKDKKKDKKKVKSEDSMWIQSLEDMITLKPKDQSQYYSIYENDKFVTGTTVKEEVEKLSKQMAFMRDGKITAKDESGNVIWS
jgi:hypothetical protein